MSIKNLYKAIASYKNDTTYKLLQVPFTEVKHKDIRKYHLEFVFEALPRFYFPIYEPLLWQMWEHKTILSRRNLLALPSLQSAKDSYRMTKSAAQKIPPK
jgi:hypothetical protein